MSNASWRLGRTSRRKQLLECCKDTILQNRQREERNDEGKGKRRKMKRMVYNHHRYLYVTPWVPRVLGLKQRDEVIIMNLGRAVVHM